MREFTVTRIIYNRQSDVNTTKRRDWLIHLMAFGAGGDGNMFQNESKVK